MQQEFTDFFCLDNPSDIKLMNTAESGTGKIAMLNIEKCYENECASD